MLLSNLTLGQDNLLFFGLNVDHVVDGNVVESLTHSLPPLSEADLILPPVPPRFIQSDVVTEPIDTMVCY